MRYHYFLLFGAVVALQVGDVSAEVLVSRVEREVSVHVRRYSESGDFVEALRDTRSSADPGGGELTAVAATRESSCTASQTVHWSAGEQGFGIQGQLSVSVQQTALAGWGSNVMATGVVCYLNVGPGATLSFTASSLDFGACTLNAWNLTTGSEFGYEMPEFEQQIEVEADWPEPGEYVVGIGFGDNADSADPISRTKHVFFELTVGDRGSLAVESATWGVVKALYR